MKIPTTLFGGVGGILIVFLLIFASETYRVDQLERLSGYCIDAHEMKVSLLECRRYEKNMLLRGHSTEGCVEWMKHFRTMTGVLDRLEPVFDSIGYNRRKMIREEVSQYGELFRRFSGDLEGGPNGLEESELSRYDDDFKRVGEMLLYEIQYIANLADAQRTKRELLHKQLFPAFVGIGVLLSVILALWVSSHIVRNMQQIEILMEETAKVSLDLSIGVSEHFDALKRVMGGELAVRTSESSPNELLANLGREINKTIEKLVEASSRELEQIYAMSPSGMRLITSDYRVVKSNQAMRAMSGIADPIAGTTCHEQLGGAFCGKEQCVLQRILKGDASVELTVDARGAGGTEGHYLLKAIPLRDDDGMLIGVIENFTDIGRIKESEDELSRTVVDLAVSASEIFTTLQAATEGDLTARVRLSTENELLSQLGTMVNGMISRVEGLVRDLKYSMKGIVDSLGEGLIVLNRERKIEIVNPYLETMFLYGSSELLGGTIDALLTPEGAAAIEEAGFFAKRTHVSCEITMRCKAGPAIPVLISGTVILDEGGAVARTIILCRDIGDRKKFETALQEQKDWLEVILSSIGDCVVVTDSIQTVTFVNPVAERTIGWSSRDMLGKPVCDIISFIDERTGEMIPSLIEGVIAERVVKRVHTDVALKTKQGMQIPVSYSIAPVTGRSGVFYGAVIVFRDVSERRQMERQLQMNYDELKKTQVQLIQMEKMASVGTLAAGVAHEINNPLAYVMSNLHALARYKDRLTEFTTGIKDEWIVGDKRAAIAELKDRLKIAALIDDMPSLIAETLDGADRIKRIVQGIRSFADSERSEMEDVDINRNIELALTLVVKEIKHKASVVKEYGDIHLVRGYANQLTQMFMNLLVNAAQAIEQYGTITVRTYETQDAIVAEISDNGIGIPEVVRGKLFDPFFTTKDVGKGSGLGLSVVHGIVKRHNGAISVTSEVGKGSTFSIAFPLGWK